MLKSCRELSTKTQDDILEDHKKIKNIIENFCFNTSPKELGEAIRIKNNKILEEDMMNMKKLKPNDIGIEIDKAINRRNSIKKKTNYKLIDRVENDIKTCGKNPDDVLNLFPCVGISFKHSLSTENKMKRRKSILSLAMNEQNSLNECLNIMEKVKENIESINDPVKQKKGNSEQFYLAIKNGNEDLVRHFLDDNPDYLNNIYVVISAFINIVERITVNYSMQIWT